MSETLISVAIPDLPPKNPLALSGLGPPTATAPANCASPGSVASAPTRKYFDLMPAHSKGPSNTLRSPSVTDEKACFSVFEDLVTSA